MGFRFQRRLRLFKGVSLNIGKRGISSISLGTRGAHTTLGKSGIRNTIGLPGTGLSYTTFSPWKSRPKQVSSSTTPGSTTPRPAPRPSAVGTVVSRMLRALTGYAVVCVVGYLGWQYISQASKIASAPSPAAIPTSTQAIASSQTADTPAPSRKVHRSKKHAEPSAQASAVTAADPNITPPSSDATGPANP